MEDALKYKGYLGSVHYSAKNEVLYGKIVGVRAALVVIPACFNLKGW